MTEKEKLESIKNNHTTPMAGFSASFQLMKIITVGSWIITIILAMTVAKLASTRQIVVGIDPTGMPIPMQVKKDNLERLIDYKLFITNFLTRIYAWNSDTYVSQIRMGLPLMAPDIRRKYLEQVDNDSFTKSVEASKMKSYLQLQPIPDRYVKYKDGFLVEVEAIKIRAMDFLPDKTIPVKFRIGFRNCQLSEDNFWGLEVFELQEIPLVDVRDSTGDRK